MYLPFCYSGILIYVLLYYTPYVSFVRFGYGLLKSSHNRTQVTLLKYKHIVLVQKGCVTVRQMHKKWILHVSDDVMVHLYACQLAVLEAMDLYKLPYDILLIEENSDFYLLPFSLNMLYVSPQKTNPSHSNEYIHPEQYPLHHG